MELSAPFGFKKIIHAFKLFHQIFVAVILIFSFFILFIVIVLLRKIKLAINVICRLGKLIETISLFYYNIKTCEQQIEDIEKVIDEISENRQQIEDIEKAMNEISKISKENNEISEISKENYEIPQFNISSEESIYGRIDAIPNPNFVGTGAIPKRQPVPKMRKSTRIYKMMNELENNEAAKLDVTVKEKIVDKPKTKAVVTTEQQHEQQDEKVTAASKLSGIKETKKFESIEMIEIVSKPETDAQSQQWKEIKLTDENTDDMPENSFFLFRMIKNQRFKNLFENCCRCKNKKCNCVSE